MSILPTSIDFKSEFPKQSRRLRLGVVGGADELVLRVMCNMHICHERKLARLFSKFEIVRLEPRNWEACQKCSELPGGPQLGLWEYQHR